MLSPRNVLRLAAPFCFMVAANGCAHDASPVTHQSAQGQAGTTSTPAMTDNATPPSGGSGGGPAHSARSTAAMSGTPAGGASAATGGNSASEPSAGKAAEPTAGKESEPMAGSGGMPARSGCGADDAALPPEPTLPAVCSSVPATRHVAEGSAPDESQLDTQALQAALDGCAQGQAVKLVTKGEQTAFLTGPLTLPSGVTLWVDAGVTLFGTRDLKVYGSASALITVNGAGSGIVGDGIIDGQGGEPVVGQNQSFWDLNGSGGGNNPALIQVRDAKQFTLYRITLHNAPKFHVKLGADGFVVWGVTIKTPSRAKNSQGTALTPSSAHNTDGIDPGETAKNGFIVCSKISVGDDHIAIKGSGGVDNLIIAHNHFGAGHGMSIGSEFQGGVSHVQVYDLSIDGKGTGLHGGSSNGIRIKSDPSRGGLVSDISYRDVCVRQLQNPIILTPKYSSNTGSNIPQYKNITIENFHAIEGTGSKVTLDGYDAEHMNSVTLGNVVVDDLTPANISASFTDITLGPDPVNFTPSGNAVQVSKHITTQAAPNPCTGKWVEF